MAMPFVLPAVLGSISILTTAALLVVHIILAQSISDPSSSVRITAILSTVFEAIVLVALCWILFLSVGRRSLDSRLRNRNGVWFGVFALLCAVAAVVSAATMVCLSSAATSIPGTIMGSQPIAFLVGASVALGVTFASQLFFLVAHFVLAKMHGIGGSGSSDNGGIRVPQMQVKSIPYSQTSPAPTRPRGTSSVSTASHTPPGSSGSRSSETMNSIRSSISHVVRPISSKTRLLSTSARSPRRPESLASTAYRSSAGDDAFDSWDTSAVDPQNRQTVLQTSGLPVLQGTTGSVTGRFLETIPASPTTSRSPSPGTPLDLLEPPKRCRRSRSYSPAPGASAARARSYSAASLTPPTPSESHIHPLFRSDSPTPPPMATPGTTVTAAPNAGLLISDAQSIRTLARMRSGSLPQQPSPLSRQGSMEDFRGRVEREELRLPEHLHEEADEEDTEEDTKEQEAPEERKLTPPIPEWIMTAGARTSLYGYQSRKARGDEEDVEQPVRMPRTSNDTL